MLHSIVSGRQDCQSFFGNFIYGVYKPEKFEYSKLKIEKL